MNPNQQLHQLGQSLWLDNITRSLLDSGELKRYIDELAVTGLTSNPSIFEKAINDSDTYDAAIRASQAASTEELFFELAIDDLRRAADLFADIHRQTRGIDGWVSLEVSPLLADEAEKTIHAAIDLHQRAGRDNLFIKIPGTRAGLAAIEEATYAGVPINVTLLFSAQQTLAAADAWASGIERRLREGLSANITSVLSLFVSRWDVAVHDKVEAGLQNRLGIAIAERTYADYQRWLTSARIKRLIDAGAAPQRLLWASTGTKDPNASDVLYIESLAAPDTINTIPEKTLKAFADHGKPGALMPIDGAAADAVISSHRAAGIDVDALAEKLQRDGADAFDKSWRELLTGIEHERSLLGANAAGSR
ncbi:MAG TPA: transaldolase [Rhodanobacteraceae bacterium]|nr:transaldolase [Rhodanobacteraceae bacterium]